MEITAFDPDGGSAFAGQKLPAWTGNRPERFLNRWHAVIPVGGRAVEVDGVCTVQLRHGLIYANEVFFDRAELLREIAGAKAAAHVAHG